MSFFELLAASNKARCGRIFTSHGEIETPVFMPVGTRGSVKMLSQEDLEQLDAKIILGNTYHLYLRPGHQLIEELGGLHHFISWKRAILTDSGGFQVYSLGDISKRSEEGVRFQSHLDGSYHLITPEKSMEIQRALGSDIVMCFDECPALPAAEEDLRSSMELTLRWAQRCKQVELQSHQHLFGIIQGGPNLELRQECLARLQQLDFDGYALGGVSVGEKNEEMLELLERFVCQMPADRPRYLMGVGTPLDILNGVKSGIDMFDCVLPTRNARNGQAITHQGKLNIKKLRFHGDQLPLDPECQCPVCRRYSRAYLRHLYLVGEPLAGRLISYHNLYFYLELMKKIREQIMADKFDEYYQTFYKSYLTDQWN